MTSFRLILYIKNPKGGVVVVVVPTGIVDEGDEVVEGICQPSIASQYERQVE